ncbi:MAG: 30S ribosomal protein S6 [Planctomycetota bacterium]
MTDTATETRLGIYEAMFLISQSEAADLGGVVEHIHSLFERAGATVLAMQKWDERRLAYEINKQKRGVYLLCYFQAETPSLAGFERDCNLSERIMRVLVTKADHLTEEEIASADGREELAIESKMRAERAAERAEAGAAASVSLGAPVAKQEEPQPEAQPDETQPATQPGVEPEATTAPEAGAEPAGQPEDAPSG